MSFRDLGPLNTGPSSPNPPDPEYVEGIVCDMPHCEEEIEQPGWVEQEYAREVRAWAREFAKVLALPTDAQHICYACHKHVKEEVRCERQFDSA